MGSYAFVNTDVHATDLLQCWSQYVVSMFMQQVDVHARMCSFCTFSVRIHATGKVLKKEHEDRSIPFTGCENYSVQRIWCTLWWLLTFLSSEIHWSIALEYCTYHRNFHVFIVKLTRLGEAYCFSRQLLNKLLAAIKHLLQSPAAWNAICVTDTETPTRTFGTSKTSVPRNKAPNQFSHRRIQAKQDLNWVTAGIGK